MRKSERTFWSLCLPIAAAACCAAVLFLVFTYGMGMGAFSSDVYARFERLSTPFLFLSMAWVPVTLLGVVLGALRKWELKPYLVLAVGCLVPVVGFLATTRVLY
jgi:hypothetical protein